MWQTLKAPFTSHNLLAKAVLLACSLSEERVPQSPLLQEGVNPEPEKKSLEK